jgi:glycosyltransferase involved in cell wall biosynthesis
MKVLIISHKPPFPVIDGGCLAMSRFLENIHSQKEIENITYLSLSTFKHPFERHEIPQKKFNKVTFIDKYIDTKLRPEKALKDLIRGESYNLSRFYNPSVSEFIVRLGKENDYKLVIFESLFATVYFKDLKKNISAKFIYRAHNIENNIWKDLKNKAKNPIKKWYVSKLQEKLEIYEHDLLKTIDLILPLSWSDLNKIDKISSGKSFLIPVAMPKVNVKPNYDNTNLCFIGAFNWFPNIEAIQWFIKYVFAPLKIEFPHLQFHIAGSYSEKISNLKQIEGIHLHGFVDSSIDFIANNGIFIAPLQSGSGVKMKVLEAMSIGVPCSISPKGAEGILGEVYSNGTAEKFKTDLKSLIKNKSLRIENGLKGQKNIETFYSHQTINKNLEELLLASKNDNFNTEITVTKTKLP